jgi:hypothetical protein
MTNSVQLRRVCVFMSKLTETPEKANVLTKRHLKTYDDFVGGFLSGLSRSLAEADGARESVVASQRLESLNRDPGVSSAGKACAHRFALGADNALYLNAGVSLLCVAGADDRELAPATLYAADTLKATKDALISLASGARKKRADDAPEVLNEILKNLQDAWYAANGFKDIYKETKYLLKRGATFENTTTGIKAMSDLVEELEETVRDAKGPTIVKRFIDYVNPEKLEQLREESGEVLEKEIEILRQETLTVKDTRTELKKLDEERRKLDIERELLEDEKSSINEERDKLANERTQWQTEGDEIAKQREALGSVLDSQTTLTEQQKALEEKESQLNNAIKYLRKEGNKDALRQDVDFDPLLQPLLNLVNDDTIKTDSVTSASKIVRTANLMKAHATQQADFDAGLERPRKRNRVSTGGISSLNPLFWQQAADAFSECGSMSKALQTPGLSKQARRILSNTSTALRLRQVDRALTGVAPRDVVRATSNPDQRSLTCALWVFLEQARLHLDALDSTDAGVREKVEDMLPSGHAEERRSGLWNEMLKDAALATDRLWIFIRTLSGLIGEDAESVLDSADDEAIRASKESDKKRKEIAETVSKFQAKLIETLIGGLVKESKIKFTTSEDAANSLVVVDAETSKQLDDLASGQSGRPFFEANVALRNLSDSGKGKPQKLSRLIDELSGVAKLLHNSLIEELGVGAGVAGSTLSNLSKPANSYFVRLRDDTSAAIRAAYDRFIVEYELKAGGRRVSLWELIEGSDNLLSTRFAEFCGHLLVQNRLSTGVSAMYTNRNQAQMTATQAHVSLARLINQAAFYAARVPAPDWQNFEVHVARSAYFNAAPATTTWASGAGRAYNPARSLLTGAIFSSSGPMAHGLLY